jgi:peptide deformylase
MAVLPVITVAEPKELALLKSPAEPVAAVDDELRRFMDDMLATMYDAHGIGLAANQVGVLKRVVVMDLKAGDSEAEPAPRFYVNPEIVWKSEETAPYEEGCLSIPGVYDEVVRPSKVRVRYLDYQGQPQEEEAEGLFAVCIQHEIDHLNGVLFIDYLSRLKRERAIARVKRDQRAA